VGVSAVVYLESASRVCGQSLTIKSDAKSTGAEMNVNANVSPVSTQVHPIPSDSGKPVPSFMRGDQWQSGLAEANVAVALVPLTEETLGRIGRLAATLRQIDAAFERDTAPMRLRAPVVSGMPGMRRNPVIKPERERCGKIAAQR